MQKNSFFIYLVFAELLQQQVSNSVAPSGLLPKHRYLTGLLTAECCMLQETYTKETNDFEESLEWNCSARRT